MGRMELNMLHFFMPKVLLLLFEFTLFYALYQTHVLSNFPLLRILSINTDNVFFLESVTGVAFHLIRQLPYSNYFPLKIKDFPCCLFITSSSSAILLWCFYKTFPS